LHFVTNDSSQCHSRSLYVVEKELSAVDDHVASSQGGAIAHSKDAKHQFDFDAAEMAADFASHSANRQSQFHIKIIEQIMKRSVKSFNVQVIGSDVHIDIQTERKKPHNYRIWNDFRHPDIFEVARHLNEGLTLAFKNSIKILIADYCEKEYLYIYLPIKYHSNQYSAKER
jgi:hypothetical protein